MIVLQKLRGLLFVGWLVLLVGLVLLGAPKLGSGLRPIDLLLPLKHGSHLTFRKVLRLGHLLIIIISGWVQTTYKLLWWNHLRASITILVTSPWLTPGLGSHLNIGVVSLGYALLATKSHLLGAKVVLEVGFRCSFVKSLWRLIDESPVNHVLPSDILCCLRVLVLSYRVRLRLLTNKLLIHVGLNW